MSIRIALAAAALLAGTSALAQEAPTQQVKPPVAAKKPYKVASPNGTRQDDYYWLRDDSRKNPQMLST